MAQQTKAERSASAKKAAATRKKNEAKTTSAETKQAASETGDRLQATVRVARTTAEKAVKTAAAVGAAGVNRVQSEIKKRTGN